ncbi:hypothetical protein HanIR_Chr08g0364171 [Helianthus annuus]|nr:hypothetical protein HanIR_Chr08g0364171 [Helianthus annuus]
MNKTHSECSEESVVVDPSISSLSNRSGKAVVGRTLGLDELRFLSSSLKSAGFEGASLQYLGGLFVLISFEDGESTKNLLEAKEVWTRWFSVLSPWIGQSLPYERLAWITIHGVLPHLVSRTVFDSIESRHGKVVQSSQFLETDGDLTFDRLGILVDSGNNINGILNLSWQDKKYKVWVIEENDSWISDFLNDDEDSIAASSELGGNVVGQDRSDSEIRGVEDKEDEEVGDVLAKGDDKSLETQGRLGLCMLPCQKRRSAACLFPRFMGTNLMLRGDKILLLMPM